LGLSYPKRTLSFRPTRGVSYDVAAHELAEDFWSFAQNVLFRKGFASRVLGNRAAYGSIPTDVYHLRNALIDTTSFWLIFGLDEIHALETSNQDDVTPVAGLTPISHPWQWATTLLNGVPCATNGLDAPLYWAGSVAAPFVDLPDFPATTICKSLIAYKYHLFALDIDGPSGHFENQVLWSDAADPGAVPASWTAAADNEAGSAEIADSPGPVMCGEILRGTLMLYKRSSTTAVNYIPESNEIFAFETLFTSSGALTRHGVCDVNGQHFVVTDGDVILTDGTNRRSVAEGRMKDYLFRQLDQTYYENLFVVYDRARNEVLTFFPEQGGNGTCTKAIVYNLARDTWGVKDLECRHAAVGIVNDTSPDETWDGDSGAWDDDASYWNQANYTLATEALLTGLEDVLTLHDTADSIAIANAIRRDGLTMGDPKRVKLVKGLRVRAEAGFGSLLVRVGSSMTPAGAVTWSSEVTLTEPDEIVNIIRAGRYISLQIRSTGTEPWTVNSVDFIYEMRGYH
jgi:hypothetical protein